MTFQLATELKDVGEEKQKAWWQHRAATQDGTLYTEEPQVSACPVFLADKKALPLADKKELTLMAFINAHY